MRVLMVSPRFGDRVLGGAETLVRALATHLPDGEVEVEVASTCAVDHETWANELPPGEAVEDGVLVRRFAVGPRDELRHGRLVARLAAGERLDYLEELDLLATSVWSPGLQRFLEDEGTAYDLILLAPYLFGTTYWGVQAHPDRSALIPCLHDEPYAYMAPVRDMVEASAGCLFNTPAEERLARRLYAVPGGGVVGVGLDPPPAPAPGDFAARHGLGPYVVYAGRVEEGKRVHVLAEHVARHARERGSGVRLVLLGRGSWRVPDRLAPHVLAPGFVSEEEKRAAYAGAVALVNASELESLSLVLLEAWLEGTPGLVAAGSEVMREHVDRSGGGFAFTGYEDFAAGLDALLGDPPLARRMGEAGRAYVHETMSWPAVRSRFREVASALSGSSAAA